MDDCLFRRAARGDAPALAACIDAAYSIYSARGLDLPAVSEGIAEDIAGNLVWVAVLDGRIVGGLVLVLKADHAVLANIAVDPEAAGGGIGRKLLGLAEAEAQKRGLHTLRLNTHVGIPENVALYKHFGWQETGRAGNTVAMAKRLGG